MMEEEGIESQINTAMLSRVQHFTQLADSLTFEGVRRLLEEDLGLDTYALDVHKRFVKQLLQKYMKSDDDDISKNSGETVEENVISTKELAESAEKHQTKKEVKEPGSGDEEKTEDSPAMGLLAGKKSAKSKVGENQGSEKKEIPSESTVKKAIWKRAAYFKANSEEITLAGVRRLLEEDLELDKYTLDPLKKFISKELDEVLASKNSKSASDVKKKSTGGSSDSSGSESDEREEEVKPKKKVALKGKVQKSEGGKRKRNSEETKVSSKKQSKLAKTVVELSDSEGGNASEDGQSQSPAEELVKKKEVSAPVNGKHVEHLKSVIRSCGMSVAPVVYKKAKQLPDNIREAFFKRELEEILSREGLSANPSEKEINEVRKRKEKAKELEGIDMSNIVLSSRRRSASSFVPPPKPKITVESDESNEEDTDEDEDDDEGDDDGEDSDVDDGDDSQSEEFQEEDEDSD